MTQIDPQTLAPWVKLGADALAALKNARDLLPKGKDREQVGKKIEEAETALGLAYAQTASALGYHLCMCTFPPQIKLAEPSGQMKCPRCDSLSGIARPVVAVPKKLSQQQEAILKWIADAGSDGGYFSSLCGRFGLHESKARVILQPLFEGEFIFERQFDGSLMTAEAGDKYLVDNGLV